MQLPVRTRQDPQSQKIRVIRDSDNVKLNASE